MELNKSQLELLAFISEVNDVLKLRFKKCEYTNNAYELHFIDDNDNYIIFNIDRKTVLCSKCWGSGIELNKKMLNELEYCLSLLEKESIPFGKSDVDLINTKLED